MEDLKDWGVDVPIDWNNGIESEIDDLSAKSKEKEPKVCPHCGKKIK
jgi:hypothetical protein